MSAVLARASSVGGDGVDDLSAFVAGIRYEDLSDAVTVHAKHVWLDTLGVILAGSAEPHVARLAGRLAKDGGRASILGDGCPRAEAASAALVNGAAGTALELDEGHRPTGHPAIYVIPALLAAGEEAASGGRDLIGSLVAGYEVGARLAAAATLRSEVHVHGAVAPVAAAAAVSHLLDRDERSIAGSIRTGACLSLAAPFRAAFDGALVRNAYAGIGGALGLTARELAASGMSGYVGAEADVLGEIVGTSFSPERLAAAPSDELMIRTNYFKRHAACRYTHGVLDAVEAAVGGRRLSVDEIDGVTVRCDANAARCARTDPENTLAAKFSVPFAVATMLVNGRTDAFAFRDEMTADPGVRRLAERVSIHPAEVIPAGDGWPAYPAAVEIHLANGERLAGEVVRPVGDQPDPLPLEDVRGKFLELTAPVVKPGHGPELLDLVLHLEELRVAELFEGVRRATADGSAAIES